jgi:hypothetical protein
MREKNTWWPLGAFLVDEDEKTHLMPIRWLFN